MRPKANIRSREVNEVLNTPPNLLVSWGNSAIIVLLLFILVFSNQLTVPIKIKIPFEVVGVKESRPKGGLFVYTLALTSLPKGLNSGRKLSLTIDRTDRSGSQQIDGRVRKVDFETGTIMVVGAVDVTNSSSANRFFVREGVTGVFETEVGHTSFLNMFIDSITVRQ